MSMLDEDEEYEDDVLYERRGTPVLRSARPELVVPTPWTRWLWTRVYGLEHALRRGCASR